MSKIIKLTSDVIEEVKRDFEESLRTLKASDGKISYTRSLTGQEREASLIFTEKAWIKMQSLVRDFDKEIGWHGVCTRDPDPDKDVYIVSDIMVYPQTVTGSNVETDQQKYQGWLMDFDDDTFNNIRFQGHSHVNMGVTPSSVDERLYERILDQLSEDMFYVFAVWNKRGEKTIRIYDMRKNVLFETADVTVSVLGGDLGLEEFMTEAKGLVQSKAYTPPVSTGSYPSAYGTYSGYNTTAPTASESKQHDKPKNPVTPAKKTGSKYSRKEDKMGGRVYDWHDDDYNDRCRLW